jgi:hypothetical protein
MGKSKPLFKFLVLGNKLRTLHTLDKCSTTELYPHPSNTTFKCTFTNLLAIGYLAFFFFFWFLVVVGLGFELRVLCLLGSHSATWAHTFSPSYWISSSACCEAYMLYPLCISFGYLFLLICKSSFYILNNIFLPPKGNLVILVCCLS